MYTRIKEKLRQWLLLRLRRYEHWQIVAFGGLNEAGRAVFYETCMRAYGQTKKTHPDYPYIPPHVLVSFAKRFLGAWLNAEKQGKLSGGIKNKKQ